MVKEYAIEPKAPERVTLSNGIIIVRNPNGSYEIEGGDPEVDYDMEGVFDELFNTVAALSRKIDSAVKFLTI